MGEKKLAEFLSGGVISIPTCSISQYQKNARFVKRMNERALEELMSQLGNCQQVSEEKGIALEEKNQQLTEKDTQLRLIKQELRQLKDDSITQFALGAISALASGLGINLVTASPPIDSGWLVVGFAVSLQIVSLLMNYQKRSREVINGRY